MVWPVWVHEMSRESGEIFLYIKLSYMTALLFLLIKKGMTYLFTKPDILGIDPERNKNVLPLYNCFVQ